MLRRSQGFGPARAKFESGVLFARRGKHDQGHDSGPAESEEFPKTLSSRMLCAASPSRSKGSKQSRPRLIAADVTGCNLPANTSKKSRLEAGCKCESDELACAGRAGFAMVCGRQGWRQGRSPWPL